MEQLKRPKMANEAIELIQDGQEIEMQNNHVFTFMRYVEAAFQNIKLSISANKLNKGYSVIKKEATP